jgi:hypothetical protein
MRRISWEIRLIARAVHFSGLQRLSLNGSRRSSLTCCQWVSVEHAPRGRKPLQALRQVASQRDGSRHCMLLTRAVALSSPERPPVLHGRGRLRTRRCGRGTRPHRTRMQDRRRYLLCDAMSGGRACEEGGESRDARAGLRACLSNSPRVQGATAVQHRRFACDAPPDVKFSTVHAPTRIGEQAIAGRRHCYNRGAQE